MHCYTRSIDPDETSSHSLLIVGANETRAFCEKRYELSKKLPNIIKTIGDKKCFHTGKGNHLTIEILKDDGTITCNYEIYFNLTKPSKKSRLTLYVQSAYVRDDEHNRAKSQKLKPIQFKILAYNVKHKKAFNTN